MSRSHLYNNIVELPRTIAIFPLARALVLPGLQLPLNIFEPRYLAMVDDCLGGERVIGMIQPHAEAPGGAGLPALYRVGCLGRLTSFRETGDGRYLIALEGVCRFRIAEELAVATPYRQVAASYEEFAADLQPAASVIADRDQLLHHLKHYLSQQKLNADWKAIESATTEALVNSLTLSCPFEISEKQALLEAATPTARADILLALIQMAGTGPGDPNDASLQ